MTLSPVKSARHSEARAVLKVVYDGRGRVQPVIVNIPRVQDFHGVEAGRALDAARTLESLGYLHRYGATSGGTMYAITSSGVDAMEDPEELDRSLPILVDTPSVKAPEILAASKEVAAAINDAAAAIGRDEPASAIDRVHTALHARIREICAVNSIPLDPTASLVSAFAALWKGHPEAPKAHREAERVMHNLGSALQALNEIRNNASLAHGRPLLDKIDATLAINATRAVAQYIEARFAPNP
jgi:hypothetical protein